MLGARKKMKKQVMLLFAGIGLTMLIGLVGGCNNGMEEKAKRVAAMQQMLGNQSDTSTNSNVQQTTPTQAPPTPNPGSETPEDGEGQEYSGPQVIVEEFSVKVPFEGFEGSRRFDIRCEVQAEGSMSIKGIWRIIAFDSKDQQVGSQELHLVIPSDELRPLILNSFYCAQVPAFLEFQLTSKTAKKVNEEEGEAGSKGPIGVGTR